MPETRWGPWAINTKSGCLEFDDGDRCFYQLPLEEFSSSAKFLDWIFQFSQKTWATDSDVGHLVRALQSIFGRGVAGGGIDNQIDPVRILSSKYGI